jgi:hypothetical protein
MQTAKQQLIDQAVNHVKITDEVFESFVHHAAYARPFLPPPEATCLDDLMSHAVQLRYAYDHLDETGSPKARWDAWLWFTAAQTASASPALLT